MIQMKVLRKNRKRLQDHPMLVHLVPQLPKLPQNLVQPDLRDRPPQVELSSQPDRKLVQKEVHTSHPRSQLELMPVTLAVLSWRCNAC
jgi:hypothetical protein